MPDSWEETLGIIPSTRELLRGNIDKYREMLPKLTAVQERYRDSLKHRRHFSNVGTAGRAFNYDITLGVLNTVCDSLNEVGCRPSVPLHKMFGSQGFSAYAHLSPGKISTKERNRWISILEKISWQREIFLRIKDKISPLVGESGREEDIAYIIYGAILGRVPDEEGLKSCVRDIERGKDPELICVEMLESKEFHHVLVSQIKVWKNAKKYMNKRPIPKRGSLRVRYIGQIGTSGYARMAKLLVMSLVSQGVDVRFDYSSISSLPEDVDEEDKILYSLIDRGGREMRDYDVLIAHTTPRKWPAIERYNRKISLRPFKMYGITVWETDTVPRQWVDDLRVPHMVSFPNEWNKKVFQDQVRGLQTECLRHPISLPSKGAGSDIRRKGYMFYTINEWTGRKGMDDLLIAFCQEFTKRDDVSLYLKTFTGGKRGIIERYISNILSTLDEPPTVYVDERNLSHGEIRDIHDNGDCYISLTRAEGMGCGLCEAALLDKPIISNSYGAQSEYLKGCMYTGYDKIPAEFCTDLPAHDTCRGGICKHNSLTDPATHSWGRADIIEARRLMRFCYNNSIKEGNPTTKKYLLEMSSIEVVGQNLVRSLQSLIKD